MKDREEKSMVFSESILQHLAAQTKSLLFIFDPQQKIIRYLSDSSCHFFGADADRIKNDPHVLETLLHPDDKDYVLKELNQLNDNHSLLLDFRLLLSGKEVKWVHTKACVFTDAGIFEGCVVGFAEDITDRKEYELSLYNIYVQKDVALQILGHDLRAPIHTISSATTLLGYEINQSDLHKIEPYFEIINTTCQNALDLINDLLKSVYWDSQKTNLTKRINLLKKVKNQLDAYRMLHKGGKTFRLNTSADAIYIQTDPVRFQLIMENLLTNAFKFTKANGKIEVSVVEHADKVTIEVADDGIGIPEELKPMIFDKFSKARRPGNQGEKPVGLGLHIVKTLVEQLNGKIWFESEERKGTTFFLELPLQINPDQ